MTRKSIGIGVIGFGWMGMAHSRGFRRIPSFFPDREFDPRLVICGDNMPGRGEAATSSFGFEESTDDWRAVVDHPDVDVVVVTAPNMMHVDVCVAAAEAGKHVFCEKPVGGTPEQTATVEKATRDAGVITGVGYNYRFAPLVQYAKKLIDEGALGEITNYRGRFFSMYGADPMGLLSWRFQHEHAGYGVSTDILSHSVDLALHLVGPIDKVMGTGHTYITDRPLPKPGGTHYDRGAPGDPTGPVENEDYFGAMVVFGNGARGTFETSRAIMGPESQNAFEVYGTKGSIMWNFEKMNELQVYLVDDSKTHNGYTTVFGGDKFPPHGNFVPGAANALGFEDLITIEDHDYLAAVAAGRQHNPGFAEAINYVSVQSAMIKSWKSERWEPVTSVAL